MTDLAALVLFTCFIVALLVLDLRVFRQSQRSESIRPAALWSIFYVFLALTFDLGLYVWRGPQSAVEFLTGYVLEQSLSLDNLFVFVMIFDAWAVRREHQHRVLFWGIFGALATRAAFVAAGVALLAHFRWVFYVFGAFLLFSGARLAFRGQVQIRPERNLLLRLVRRVFPLTEDYEKGKFFLRREGRLYATPLVMVVVLIESADLVFAMDSIPAIFGITRDPFTVYTATCFGVLGLRALYTVLAGALVRFRYLRQGISVILAFAGVKIVAANHYPISAVASLVVVSAILTASIALSLFSRKEQGSAR